MIDDFVDNSPMRDGSDMNYPTVSLFEVQMYDKELIIPPDPVVTASDIANGITSAELNEDETMLVMPTVPK